MSAVLLVGSRSGLSMEAATRYLSIGHGMPLAFITEANSQVVFREPGTLSKLWVRVNSNDHTSLAYRVRINGSDGNLTCSYGSSETGIKKDDTNSDAVAAGDTLSLSAVASGGTAAAHVVWVLVFTPTTDSPTLYTNQANFDVSTSSVTEFIGFAGRSSLGSVEADHRFRALVAGRLKYLRLRGTNNGANTVTFRSRVNGVNGNLVVAIAGGGSHGEDTTNEDTIAAGDDIGLSVTTGAGMVASSFPLLHCTFIPDSGFQYVSMMDQAFLSPSTTYYFSAGGSLDSFATEAECSLEARFAQRLSKLAIYVSTNGNSSSSTFRLRINGANSTQVITIGAGVTGFLQDATHTDDVAAGDLIDYQLVTGAGGSDITLTYAVMLSEEVAGDETIWQMDDLPIPALPDLLAVVDDVAGTPTTKKATLANIISALALSNVVIQVLSLIHI